MSKTRIILHVPIIFRLCKTEMLSLLRTIYVKTLAWNASGRLTNLLSCLWLWNKSTRANLALPMPSSLNVQWWCHDVNYCCFVFTLADRDSSVQTKLWSYHSATGDDSGGSLLKQAESVKISAVPLNSLGEDRWHFEVWQKMTKRNVSCGNWTQQASLHVCIMTGQWGSTPHTKTENNYIDTKNLKPRFFMNE